MSDPDRKQLMNTEEAAAELLDGRFSSRTIRRHLVPLAEWIAGGRFETGDVPFVQLFAGRYVPRWWIDAMNAGGLEPQWLSDALDSAGDA